MQILRLLLAGLVAVAAMIAVAFAAFVVLVSGLVAFVLQLFRPQPPARAPGQAARSRAPVGRMEDVIDVESTKVTDDRPPV